MCPWFVWSPIKGLWRLLLEVLLVFHRWILLLWVLLLGRIKDRLVAIRCHTLLIAPSRAHHSIPPPRNEKESHRHAEEEYTYFSAHYPGEVSSSKVSLRHTRLLGMHIAIPLDRVKFDWVLGIGVSLEHLVELRIMLLPIPLFKGYSLRRFSIGRPRLSGHFLEVATLVITTVILFVISVVVVASLHFCDYKKSY